MRSLTAYLNATSNAMTWVDSTGTAKNPGFTCYRREWLDLTVNVTRSGVAAVLPATYTYTIAGKDGRTLAADPSALILASTKLWSIGTDFGERDIVFHGGQGYRVLKGQGHTATADDEPGVGVNEATYWETVDHDPTSGVLQFSINCNTAALLAYLQAGGTLATISDGARRGRGRMIEAEVVGVDSEGDEVEAYGQGPVAAILDIVTGSEEAPLFNPSLLHVSSTSDPTVDDDSADGFSRWSTWANTTTGVLFVCTDPSVGAAAWETFATLEDIQALGYLGTAASTELTINAGSVTPTQQHHTLDTEGDAATDELATIPTRTGFLLLRLANAARIVTLTHGTGANQITCPGAANLQMDYSSLYLLHRAAVTDPWRIVGVGGSSGIPAPASPAQGDVLYYNGSAWTRLPAGTNGHFLKTQGEGANPIWAAASGGGAPSVAAYTGPYQNITVYGAWRTVTLDTEVSDPDSIAAVASNQVQIAAAGTYRMRVYLSAAQSDIGNIEARIVNLTPAPDVELAYVSRYLQAAYGPTDLVMETPLFVLGEASNIEVQVYVQSDSVEIGGTSYDPSSRGAYTATRVILEKVA